MTYELMVWACIALAAFHGGPQPRMRKFWLVLALIALVLNSVERMWK